MKHVVVAVRDSAIGAFSRPFTVPAIGAAVRSFTDEVNRSDASNPMYAHPDDFELWELADWDDVTGVFVMVEPRCVTRGKDVANR